VAVGMVGVHHVGSESTIEELSILFDLGEGGDTKPW